MSNFLTKVDKTLRYHTKSFLRSARGVWWDMLKISAESPVFIIGCSRSGTTLVYKTFSESDELASLQRETHDFWASLHPLEERNWASHALNADDAGEEDRQIVTRYFYSATGCRRFVDKNNQNGLCINYLRALFPDAHFVFVKRSPGDNINSLIEGWARPDEFSTWADGLPVEVSVDEGRYTRWCFFLADGWRDYLTASIEEVCAYQYRAMNQAILDARSLVDSAQWTEIRYEELLRDPVRGFRCAFEDCGLEFGPKLEVHCQDVLSRPYNAFFEIREDKWKGGPHRERIERVLPLVSRVARELGYEA
jgi:hypothetical protein